MASHDFDVSIVARTAHRPWPMPPGPWVLTQTWRDLLFAHWPVDPVHLRRVIPGAFELDLFDGSAWLGIVPFVMSNVAPRGIPALPWISEFPELNVRTYVRVDDRPGVYFFSLDAASAVAVEAARRLLNLPYHRARMQVSTSGDRVEYRSVRDGGVAAEFRATYGPVGDVFTAASGTLEYFLTERYCLYNIDRRGTPQRLEIHHPPWSLQLAWAEIAANTMADANDVTIDESPILHFATRQDTVAWRPRRLPAAVHRLRST